VEGAWRKYDCDQLRAQLQNIVLDIPRDKLVVLTGVSAWQIVVMFDTLYVGCQCRYVESLSSYARRFWARWKSPRWIKHYGFMPAIAIEVSVSEPASTVGTVTEIYDRLRVLFARVGVPLPPVRV